MGSANGVDGIFFLLSRFGEFLPDFVDDADRGGAERFPLPEIPELPPLLLLLLVALKAGEADLEELDLLDNDEEIEDGILNGFNFTVGVFFKLLTLN